MMDWEEITELMKFKLDMGDLVEFIDIGDGTEKNPWAEIRAVGIYLGKYESHVFPYNTIKDLSTAMTDQAWHIVWSKGRRRHVSLTKDIKLLAKHRYLVYDESSKPSTGNP